MMDDLDKDSPFASSVGQDDGDASQSEAPATPPPTPAPQPSSQQQAPQEPQQHQPSEQELRANERAMMMEDGPEEDDPFQLPTLKVPQQPEFQQSSEATPQATAEPRPQQTPAESPPTPQTTDNAQSGAEQPDTPHQQAPQPEAAEEGQDVANMKKPVSKMRIGEKLIHYGLISGDQLQIALQQQKTDKRLLGAIMVDMGFITESALSEVLAESSGVQKFDPKTTMLDSSLIKKMPKEQALRHKVLPVSMENNTLQLAMADIHNVLAIDQARRYFPKNVHVQTLFSTESEILDLIDQYYDYELEIEGILKEIETGIRQEEGRKLEGETEGYTNPTVRLVNAILVDAIRAGASDIHFEPEGNFLRLRYRLDGVMQQVRSFHLDYWSAIAVRIKIMSGMNIAEVRNPQDGRITYNVLGREVDFRVATQPTVHGENIVMRLLDKKKGLLPMEMLGFSEHNIRLLRKLLKRPEGIIIVTGPTGSGKTTTLYSVLEYINSIDVNIMTLEDPVEYQLPLIRQTQVREGTGVDFVSGIKSLMRQDPDIIFVGEVRDEETAMMAVRAALTGHQVFTTLHTNDALGAIPRLVDIGIPRHLLAGSLICTLAQRLARKLCDHCKEPRLASPEESRILGYDPGSPPTVYDHKGCEKCNFKGYKGRVALVEILQIDKGFDELVATGSTRNSMLEYALENGFIPMVNDGVDKVILGQIDIPELINTVDMTERL